MNKRGLNDFQKNPLEYRRVRKIISAGMTKPEIQRFFVGLKSYEFLRATGDQRTYKREGDVVKALIARFVAGQVPKEPYIPAIYDVPDPGPGNGVEAPEADEQAPICGRQNCGGVSQIMQMLRWEKALSGIPVSVSIDMANAPTIKGYSRKSIEQEILKWLKIAPGLKLDILPEGEEVGDIHIKHDVIDGVGDANGNIFGITYQPRTALDMAAGGDLSGDIIIDSGDLWELRGILKLLLTLRHEFGHGIGAPHLKQRTATMYNAPTTLNLLDLSIYDAEWAGEAYPLNAKIGADYA